MPLPAPPPRPTSPKPRIPPSRSPIPDEGIGIYELPITRQEDQFKKLMLNKLSPSERQDLLSLLLKLREIEFTKKFVDDFINEPIYASINNFENNEGVVADEVETSEEEKFKKLMLSGLSTKERQDLLLLLESGVIEFTKKFVNNFIAENEPTYMDMNPVRAAAAARLKETNERLRLLNHYLVNRTDVTTAEEFKQTFIFPNGIKILEGANTFELDELKRVFAESEKFYDSLQKFVEADIKDKNKRPGQKLNDAETESRLEQIIDGTIRELVTLLKKHKIPFFDKYYGRTINESDEVYLKYLRNLIIEYKDFKALDLGYVSVSVGGSRKRRRRVRTRKVKNKSNKRSGSKKSKKNNNINKL